MRFYVQLSNTKKNRPLQHTKPMRQHYGQISGHPIMKRDPCQQTHQQFTHTTNVALTLWVGTQADEDIVSIIRSNSSTE